MSLELANLIVSAISIYFAIGALFALWFVIFGAKRIDPAAKGMPIQARILVFFGTAALWPLMLVKSFIQKSPTVS